MKKTFFLAAVASLFLGCSGGSDGTNHGTISMKFNGEQISARVTSATLTYIDGAGKRFDISAENNSNTFQIAIASTSMNEEFNTNEYTDENANLDDNQGLFYTSYKVGGNTYGEHMPSDVSIYKTQQDINNNVISGTFTSVLEKVGELQNQVNTPDEIVITEGKFNNIKYDVIQ